MYDCGRCSCRYPLFFSECSKPERNEQSLCIRPIWILAVNPQRDCDACSGVPKARYQSPEWDQDFESFLRSADLSGAQSSADVSGSGQKQGDYTITGTLTTDADEAKSTPDETLRQRQFPTPFSRDWPPLEGEMQAQSELLIANLGPRQYYIRPMSFYEPFDIINGDNRDSRYAKARQSAPTHLNPLDYELFDEFLSRMKESCGDRFEGLAPLLSPVFNTWALRDSNWPFLRDEERKQRMNKIIESAAWPQLIMELMTSWAPPLLDDQGHFIPPERWINTRAAPKKGIAPMRYRFARLMARRDPHVLPYEWRADFIERQLGECHSSKSRVEINAIYVAWFGAPENAKIVPRE